MAINLTKIKDTAVLGELAAGDHLLVESGGLTKRIQASALKQPGMVFDTVADMEVYITSHADKLTAGMDLFIREEDAPDYWWDGEKAVAVETDLSVVKTDIAGLKTGVETNSQAIEANGVEIGKISDEIADLKSGISITHLGKGYIGKTGEKYAVKTASVWEAYVIPVTANSKYDVITGLSAFTDANGRVSWALTDKEVTEQNYRSLTQDDFLLFATPDTEISTPKLVCHKIETTAESKNLIVICASDSMPVSNGPVIKKYNETEDKADEISHESACRLSFEDIVRAVPNSSSLLKNNDGSVTIKTGHFMLPILKSRNFDNTLVVRMKCKNSGSKEISIQVLTDTGIYSSTRYFIDSAEYRWYEFRIPPFADVYNFAFIKFSIANPLDIREFNVSESDVQKRYTGTGVRLSAHLGGVYGYTPENSVIGFQTAAMMGYPSCISNIKKTSDGILVCHHDETINRVARNIDGSELTDDIKIAENTYEQLNAYDYGIYLSKAYAGTKLATVEQFFDVCAVTGMMPIFSVHGITFGEEVCTNIKNMLIKKGLLGAMTIKSGEITTLNSAYSVFGEDIFAYILDTESSDYNAVITAMNNSSLFGAKCRVGIEYQKNVLTQDAVTAIIDAGYFAGVYDMFGDSTRSYKKFISWGVTEIVDDYNPNYGLNW